MAEEDWNASILLIALLRACFSARCIEQTTKVGNRVMKISNISNIKYCGTLDEGGPGEEALAAWPKPARLSCATSG